MISLVLAFLSFLHGEQWGDYSERFLLKSVEEQTLVQQILEAAPGAILGKEPAFQRLRQLRDDFQTRLNELKDGVAAEGLPLSPADVGDILRKTENEWLALRERIDIVLAAETDILRVRDLSAATGDRLRELYAATEQAAKLMADKKQPQMRVLAATAQLSLIERMSGALEDVLIGGTASRQAIALGTETAGRFFQVLDGLLKGDSALGLEAEKDPEVQEALTAMAGQFRTMFQTANEMVDRAPAVLPAMAAVEGMRAVSQPLAATLDGLINAYRGAPGRLKFGSVSVGPTTVAIFGSAAILFLVLLGVRLVQEARRREAASMAQNESNQRAIQRLLDEMGELADGDLTVNASVTEDITGAIADSVNYAVAALRDLVTTINATSEKVATSTQETRAIALGLAEASAVQAEQISQATDSIQSLTQAIDEVAKNATESADVASRSVDVAGRGAQAVRDTIRGMDAIREQIQETSKRIKRLGESSQEIGEIVELIDDITDQTNILALNAAVQAAMAGEAGRGFAVVADEVQRLAERSSDATKRIDVLVRTIQADTNEAVTSMEASTAGVVGGARLAENAGDALREIENVSSYIAELTQRISDSAQNQSRRAGAINATVRAIQEIAGRHSEGTRRTAESVEALAGLAVELQRSVAGFRL